MPENYRPIALTSGICKILERVLFKHICNFLISDDTMIYTVVEDPVRAAVMLNNELKTISSWSQTWQVKFNAKKTKTILFGTKIKKMETPKVVLTQ